jgi:hypothetical protein
MTPNINLTANKMENQTFVGANVQADGGAAYFKCTFINCNLIFTGLAPIQFDTCKLENCRWSFAGPAANTLNFLKQSYAGGNKEMVETIFREIRGTSPTSDSVPNIDLKSGGKIQ